MNIFNIIFYKKTKFLKSLFINLFDDVGIFKKNQKLRKFNLLFIGEFKFYVGKITLNLNFLFYILIKLLSK